MTYQAIDKQRMHYLLVNGMDPDELKRFFDDSFKALQYRGARLRNAPYGSAARVNTIVDRLPPSTDDVLRDWFRKHFSVDDPVSMDEIKAAFQGVEQGAMEESALDVARLARSSLTHLFSSAVSELFLEFLRSPIVQRRIPVSEDVVESLSNSDERSENALYSAALSLLAATFQGRPMEGLLDQIPSTLASFVHGFNRIRQHDAAGAQEFLDQLDENTFEATVLGPAVHDLRAARGAPQSPHGLVVMAARDFLGNEDAARTSVFAYCSNDRPGATFIKPVGVVANGVLEAFTDDQRKQYFPESGDAIFFSGPGMPAQPTRGQLGVWRIEEHPTDKKVRCHITKQVCDLFSVVYVPFHSADADAIRSYIQQSSHDSFADNTYRVFELQNGMIIGPKNHRADLSREESFEQPFNLWRGLTAFPFQDQRLIAGPLPPVDGTYDCAPLTSTVKSMIKTLQEQQQHRLTRSQVREVINLFKDRGDPINSQRMERIVQRVSFAESEDAVISDMLAYVLEMPSFKARVDEGINRKVVERSQERDQLSIELTRLRSDCVREEARLRTIGESIKKKTIEMNTQVRAAFDKAITNGIDTLVASAIFNELHHSIPHGPGHTGAIRSPLVRVSVHPAMQKDDVLRSLKAYGLGARFSFQLLATFRAAANAGIIVFLRGDFSRQAVVSLARSVGNVTVIDVPMGLTDRAPDVMSAISRDSRGASVLLNANLSDLELYAPELVDVVLTPALGEPTVEYPIVLGSLSGSQMALPLPSELSRLSLIIDLPGSINVQSTVDVEDQDVDTFGEELSHSALHSAMSQRLLETIRNATPLDQTGIMAICRRSLTAGNVV